MQSDGLDRDGIVEKVSGANRTGPKARHIAISGSCASCTAVRSTRSQRTRTQQVTCAGAPARRLGVFHSSILFPSEPHKPLAITPGAGRFAHHEFCGEKKSPSLCETSSVYAGAAAL